MARDGVQMAEIKLFQGDCLELMRDIPDGSVDMVLCDLPYGTTQCAWDKVIPFEPLWQQYKRIIKNNGAIVLFSVQPFTTDLICSNRKMFRYEIIWEKTQKLGFLNAKKMPLRAHENILIFYKRLPTYNPQKYQLSEEYIKSHLVPIGRTRAGRNGKSYEQYIGRKAEQYAEYRKDDYVYTDSGERFPSDVIKFSNWNGTLFGKAQTNAAKHPTAKPVPLLEWLIRTYTNPGETVLDNCMGSGSTGVACVNTGRDFIGIELDPGYFETARKRIADAQAQIRMEAVM